MDIRIGLQALRGFVDGADLGAEKQRLLDVAQAVSRQDVDGAIDALVADEDAYTPSAPPSGTISPSTVLDEDAPATDGRDVSLTEAVTSLPGAIDHAAYSLGRFAGEAVDAATDLLPGD